VVEVDMREQQRARPPLAQGAQHRVEARARTGVDEHVAHKPGTDDLGAAEVPCVDELHGRRVDQG